MTSDSQLNRVAIQRISEPRLRVAPSLLASDFSRLAEEIRRIEAAGADMLHLDVMDGHYVPNISFGVPIIEKIRGVSGLFFDTHLMIQQPERYADSFVKAGADGVTFHTEVVQHPWRLIGRLHEWGVSAGVSLNPRTPVSSLNECLADVDLVNVMTVEPGFGGQAFMPEMLDKVRELRARLRPDQRLEVDGGVNNETVAAVVSAGADTLVAGTAVFHADDPAAAIAELKRRGEQAAAGTQA